MDDRTAPPNPGPEAARGVARALGIAWVGATLYEDPLLQEAFVRSAATLASLAPDLPPILVSASTLHLGARDLGGDDVSIKPLAQSCFVHGCAALRLGPELTAPDLAAFLEVVRLPPEVIAQEGGLAAALTGRRIGGVSADPRTDSGSGDDELRAGDEPLGWSAESLACVLRSVAPDDLAPTLLEGFARAVTIPAVAERQVAVAAHIEALMTFPPSVQATVLDWVFETDPGLAEIVFAHLASHELDRLARSLGPIGHERASRALTGRGDDHSPLRSMGSADPPGVGAAGEVPPAEEWWDGLPQVMEDLLSSGFVRAAPQQVVEAWARGFDALLRGGRFAIADAWYELALGVEDPTLRVLLDGRRHHLPGPDG
ncbi:MAG: hypothetical protein HKN46_11230, partial [Acidimicrobiia bacterium]|nr:hypothetical protein [Acidimicrobiia bacterium]